jgi:hypothetical protein
MTPAEAAALGLSWVSDDHPLYGTPGFVGWTPAPVPVPVPTPTPLPTGGPLIGQPDVFAWPPRPIMAAPGSLNAVIEHHARTGQPLPPGDVYFTPPLLLRDVAMLQGTAGRTVLRPDPAAPVTAAPAIIIDTTLPGSHELHYPMRTVVRDLMISGHHAPGSRGQIGVQIVGANIGLENVSVRGFGEGMRLLWSVNNSFLNCRFINNSTNVVLGGLESSAASGTIMVTATRFTGCSFGLAGASGILIQHGIGIIFEACVIEYNAVGIYVSPQPNLLIKAIVARDCWFEGPEQTDIVDPLHVVRGEGVTARH